MGRPGAAGFEFPFDFTAGTTDIGSKLLVDLPGASQREAWAGSDHVRALSFSDNGTVEAAVVFAGYGLKIPDGKELSYDSFFGLDVQDKIVVVLRYSPENVDDDRRVGFGFGIVVYAKRTRMLGSLRGADNTGDS